MPDLRNSKVVDIVKELGDYGVTARVYDPLVTNEEAEREYGISLTSPEALDGADAVILAVGHTAFREKGPKWIASLLRRPERGVVVDVKAAFQPEDFPEAMYWRL